MEKLPPENGAAGSDDWLKRFDAAEAEKEAVRERYGHSREPEPREKDGRDWRERFDAAEQRMQDTRRALLRVHLGHAGRQGARVFHALHGKLRRSA